MGLIFTGFLVKGQITVLAMAQPPSEHEGEEEGGHQKENPTSGGF